MQKIPWDIYKINTLLLSLVLEYFFRTTSPGGVCSLRPPLQVGEYFYNHLLQVESLASPGQPPPLLPVLTRHYRELAGYVEFLLFIIMGGPTHMLDVGPMGKPIPRNY